MSALIFLPNHSSWRSFIYLNVFTDQRVICWYKNRGEQKPEKIQIGFIAIEK